MKRKWLWFLALVGAVVPARGQTWDGPKLTSVPRQEVYEFAKPPTFKGVDKDRYEIAFASKAFCDVAVAIHDGSGKIVRHIVYGVLGANAPAPLKANSLEQTLAWDGKDDAGEYVKAPQDCTARVSLGLKPTFDKVLGHHPKDTAAGGQIIGLAADAPGVYVLQSGCHNQLRMFDHDGNYVRTLWPFPADKFEANRPFIATRTVEQDGRSVAQLEGHGNIVPMASVTLDNCLLAAAGKIGIITKGGYGDVRRLLRFRPDATTGGEPIDGPILLKSDGKGWTFGGPIFAAIAPDGKWLYMGAHCYFDKMLHGNSYSEPRPYRINTVYRFAWDRAEPVMNDDSFVGEASNDPQKLGADSDDAHLNQPRGLAVDGQGRLYILDTGNGRIQVFEPDGRKAATLAPLPPDAQRIAVHQKTGEIYLLGFTDKDIVRGALTVTKLAALPAGVAADKAAPPMPARVLLEQKFPTPPGDERIIGFPPIFAVDSWTARPRVWLVHKMGTVRIYEEWADKFELLDDFEQDVEAAGLRPHMLGAGHHNRIEADSTRNHLYYLRGTRNAPLLRCDNPDGPGRFTEIVTPSYGGGEEMDVGPDGLLYLRWLKFAARFDPSKAAVSADRIVLPLAAEVPFDYGEGEDRWKYKGVIPIEALPGANSFDTGFSVGPTGEIVSFMKNFTNVAGALIGTRRELRSSDLGEINIKGQMEAAGSLTFRPRTFPGRYISGAEVVMRWCRRGELIAADLVPALTMASCGVHLDRDGNIYCGIGANMYIDGKPHSAGSLAKFPPRGAKVFGKGDVAKLDKPPDRPPEFRAYAWGDLWTQNMFWAYPGYDAMYFLGSGHYSCLCSSCRFDLDLYARSFVPKAYQFTVGVLDTNGNVICEIGRYGNPESPAMKPGDTNIGIAECSYLATDSDRWLYINDEGNARIIRVKLGYHAQESVALK